MSQAPAHNPVIPSWSFADRLRKVRRDVVGIDQAEMAERLGWPKTAYQGWETGKARPREIVAVARRIEVLTGVPASWTLGLDDAAVITAGDLGTAAADLWTKGN